MSAPRSLTVLIEGDDTTCEAKQIPHDLEGIYGATLYEDSMGRQFFVDNIYINECIRNNTHANIPLSVIIQREQMLAKLRWGDGILNKQHKQNQTGLILPDEFKDV